MAAGAADVPSAGTPADPSAAEAPQRTVTIAGPERVVLPYVCSVEGRTIRLSPSPERAFPIVEGRVQRDFETCDPPFSRNCTRFPVHRFDLVCGGMRVSWPDMVAAMGRTKAGDAQIERGHLILSRRARSSEGLAPSCSESKSKSGASPTHECLPWRVARGVERIVLPKGFAPAEIVGARFVSGQSPDPTASSLVALAAVGGGARSTAESAGGSASPASSHDFSVTRETLPELADAVRSSPPPRLAEQWVTVVKARDLGDRRGAAASAPSRGLGFWLAGVASLAAAAVMLALRGGLPMERLAVATARLREISGPSLARLKATLPKVIPARNSLPKGPPAIDVAAAPAMLDVGVLALFSEVRRSLQEATARVESVSGADPFKDLLREEVRAFARRIEELAGSTATGEVSVVRLTAQLRAIGRELGRTARIAAGVGRLLSSSSADDKPLPETRDEALALFGLKPDAGDEAALSRFVESVRLACHPDFAADAVDRMERLRRMQKFEAAWALLLAQVRRA